MTLYFHTTFYACLLLFSQATFSVTSDAENLQMEGLDGKQHSLSEYFDQNKWLIVNVWGTSCPYCRMELFDLTSFHNKHHKQDAMVIGLTLEFPSFNFPKKQSVSDFALDYFIDYPLLLVDRKLASKVIGQNIDMIPLTFIYNPHGKLVHRISGAVTEKMLEDIIKTKSSNVQIEKPERNPLEEKL